MVIANGSWPCRNNLQLLKKRLSKRLLKFMMRRDFKDKITSVEDEIVVFNNSQQI